MGGIIASFLNKEDVPTDIIVNFDSAWPLAEAPHKPQAANPPPAEIPDPEGTELAMYKSGIDVLKNAEAVLMVLDGYEGCGPLIQRGLQHPHNAAIQLETFEGMFPNVERVKAFYTLAKAMDELAGKLVRHLIDTQSFTPALLKLLAQLLVVSLKFDRSKMMHPAIQNDFSQYRRGLGRNLQHPGVPVNDIEANNISMFIAQATPIMSAFGTTLDNMQRQGKDVIKFLADFAHICCAFVMRERADKAAAPEPALLALTAMTVAFVLFDNVSPTGVFGKGSLIDVRTCVGQIKAMSDAENRGILCDALHFSTRSFDKAPDSVKRVIEAR